MINLQIMMTSQEFYEIFWEEIKTVSNSIRKSFLTEELNTSQKQALIKLIAKQDR